MSLGENSLVAAYQGKGQWKSRPSGTRVVTRVKEFRFLQANFIRVQFFQAILPNIIEFCRQISENFDFFRINLWVHKAENLKKKLSKIPKSNNAATMVSAARRQIIGGGAPINKSRRRRPQIVGGGAAGARLYSQSSIAKDQKALLSTIKENSAETSNALKTFPASILASLNAFPFKQYPSTEAYEEDPVSDVKTLELGEIATKYLQQYASDKRTVDTSFGINSKVFNIGNSSIAIHNNGVTVGD